MSPVPIEVPDWIRSVVILDPTDIWGNVVGMGLGELAAVLTHAKRYDRRGDVVWLTNFDHGLQGVTPGVDNAASTVELTTLTAVSGGFSLAFDPRAAADSYGNYRRVFYPLIGGKVGAEFAFAIADSPHAIYFRLTFFNGEHRYPGWVTYTPSTKDWTILNSAGGETIVLEDDEVQTGTESWHYLKIVIDTDTQEYHRLLIDNNVVPVSTYALQEIDDTGLGIAEVKFEVQGSATAHAPGYLDSIILTQNEPV